MNQQVPYLAQPATPVAAQQLDASPAVPPEPATILPVILAGGTGTRLWPLSRARRPKQFQRLAGRHSLFQAAALRLTGADIARPLVVTQSDFRFIAAEQLSEIGCDPGPVILEPGGRNTAPAVLAALLIAAASAPEALMLVCPSDHAIDDAAAFQAAVAAGRAAAEAGRIVTFGITPDRAETGYGYLELAEPAPTPDAAPGPLPLRRFVEKPNAAWAAAMVADGRHLWNSGIFLARVATLLAAFARHQPAMLAAVEAAVAGARPDLGFLRLAPAPWEAAEPLSLDHAVMEHARDLAVVPLGCGWSDLGSWDAIARVMGPDATGTAVAGPAEAIDCEATLLRAESPDQLPGGDRAEEHRRHRHARRGAGGRPQR